MNYKNKTKYSTTVIFFILWCNTSFLFGQPNLIWEKSFGGSEFEFCWSAQPTNDGGFVMVGSTGSNDGDVTGFHGLIDYWIVKTDGNGILQWQSAIGGSVDENAFSVHQTSDEGFIVLGYSQSNDGDCSGNHGQYDFWLTKLDFAGNLMWQKMLGGSSGDIGQAVRQCSDGGYIVTGQTTSHDGDVTNDDPTTAQVWVARLDNIGNIVWKKTFGGSSTDFGNAVRQTSDGGFILLATTLSNDGDVSGNHGGFDFWLLRLDEAGNVIWKNTYGGTTSDEGRDVIQTSDGGFVATGTTSDEGGLPDFHGVVDAYMIRTDMNGNLIWQKTYGGNDHDAAYSVSQTPDGGYLLGGSTYSSQGMFNENHGEFDYWVVKTNSTGTVEWDKIIGGSGIDECFSAFPTSDGSYVLAGYSESTDGDVSENKGGYDFWLVKLGLSNPCSDHKIAVCHNGKTICVDSHAVQAHLAHGDLLGPCEESGFHPNSDSPVNSAHEGFSILGNPNKGQFRIKLEPSLIQSSGRLIIISTNGQLIEERKLENKLAYDFNIQSKGVYFVCLENSVNRYLQMVVIF